MVRKRSATPGKVICSLQKTYQSVRTLQSKPKYLSYFQRLRSCSRLFLLPNRWWTCACPRPSLPPRKTPTQQPIDVQSCNQPTIPLSSHPQHTSEVACTKFGSRPSGFVHETVPVSALLPVSSSPCYMPAHPSDHVVDTLDPGWLIDTLK